MSKDERARFEDESAIDQALKIALGRGATRTAEREAASLVARGFAGGAPPLEAQREERIARRARAIFKPEREGVLRLVVERVRGALAVIEAVGDLLTPLPARGESGEGVLVTRRFGSREVSAFVTSTPAPRFIVTLDVRAAPSDAATRVSVFKGDRELSSEVARSGQVMLPELGAGHYRVVLSAEGRWVGELDLTFAAAAA